MPFSVSATQSKREDKLEASLGEQGTGVIAHTCQPLIPHSWVVPIVTMILILLTRDLKALKAEMKEFSLCGSKPIRTVQGQSWDLIQVCGAPTLQAPGRREAVPRGAQGGWVGGIGSRKARSGEFNSS